MVTLICVGVSMSFRIGHRNSCSQSKAPHPGRVDTSRQLKELRTRLEAMSLDAFIITRDDEHQVSIKSVISSWVCVCVCVCVCVRACVWFLFGWSSLNLIFVIHFYPIIFHFVYIMSHCTEYQISDTGVNIPSVFHISLILSPVTVYRL